MEPDLEHEKFSTATSNKCLMCNKSTSKRNAISIFCMSSSKRTLIRVIDDVLGEKFVSNNLHSTIVCRQCCKSLNDAEDIKSRLKDIKLNINTQFQNTLFKYKFKNEQNQTLYTSDNSHESDTQKPVKKQKYYSKIVEEPISNTIFNSITIKKEKEDQDEFSLEENLLETLEEDAQDNIEGTTQKLVQPDNIKQFYLNSDKNVKNMENIDREDDGIDIQNVTIPADGNLYIEKNKTKNEWKSNSSKYSIKKKFPEFLIPQMVVRRVKEVYTCLLCSVENEFKSDASGFAIHAKNVHQINVFICKICGEVFVKSPELLEHLKQHNVNRYIVCKICSEKFTDEKKFRLHTKIHIPQSKNHSCETCGLKFASLDTLNEHNNTHTTDVLLHPCETCDMTFTSKHILEEHLKVHVSDDEHTMLSQDHGDDKDETHDSNIEYVTVTVGCQEQDQLTQPAIYHFTINESEVAEFVGMSNVEEENV